MAEFGQQKHKFPIEEEIKVLKHLVNVRKDVYEKRIMFGEMKKAEANKAIMIMKQTVLRLEAIKKEQQGTQNTLF